MVGLPLGNFLVSLGGIITICSSIFAGDFRKRFKLFKENKNALALTSLFFLSVLGGIYSTDTSQVIHELRMILPILLFPFVFATMPPISEKWKFIILHFFVLAVISNSIISFTHHLNNTGQGYRDIVLFISHIRYSLMLVLSIHILVFYFFKKSTLYKIGAVLVAGWLLYFLNLYESGTGLIVLILSIIVGTFWVVFYSQKKFGRILLSGFSLVLVLGLTWFFVGEYKSYFQVKEAIDGGVDLTTASGEKYKLKKNLGTLENGHYLYRYFAPNETKVAWDQISVLKHDEKDKNGHEVFGTLIRYLTSKGLRKDREGVRQLSKQDIANIHNGQTNFLASEQSGWQQRIRQVLYEIDRYKAGYNPSESPTISRLYFWEAGLDAFMQSPIIGVGTGDIKQSLLHSYERIESPLDDKSRKLVHNQFLTVAIQFGVIGLLWFIIVLLYPLIFGSKPTVYLGLIFLSIFLVSCVSEDTLNTQAGLSFFTVFYCFFFTTRKF